MVVYGTKRGSTAEIAQFVAGILRDRGLDAESLPASEVTDLDGYDAVLMGGALYGGRWPRDVRRFARRHRRALRERPVWMFSSGPLDSSASKTHVPPPPGVQRIMQRTRARDHVTFGGRLEAGAEGRVARMIVEDGRGGDFRDFARIAAWATAVATEVGASPESL
ncbi:flavodoxin domain-containing protein [Kitasatospora cinereorecta]